MSTYSLRRPNGTFAPGHPGLGGRPPGARAKLNSAVEADITKDWLLHGAETIERVRKEYPQTYFAKVLDLLPKERTVEMLSPLGHLSDEELQMLGEYLTASRAKLVQQLEGAAVNELPAFNEIPGK